MTFQAAAALIGSRQLADAAETSTTGDYGPGLVAFLIVAALAVATFLLIRSMLAHIRKVPPSFDTTEEGRADESPSTEADADNDR